MIRTILASLNGTEADGPVLSAAARAACAFGAYVHAAHPRFDPAAVVKTAGVAHPTGIIADLVQRLGHAADERAAKAKASTEEMCAQEGLPFTTDTTAPPSVQWRVVPNEPARLAAYGMTADLIIAPRPSADDPSSRSTFNTLLFQTGRPVLTPGRDPSADFFQRVAVAWKSTPQAARALAFAMPFLARAAMVTVLTAEEDEDHFADLDGVISYLSCHGVKAEGRRLSPSEGSAAAAVLGAAQSESLLVMGAYGHSRTREWMFGGFTRTVIRESPIPVLMAH
jgi:nucleotide-binding universal stress UspA family protein